MIVRPTRIKYLFLFKLDCFLNLILRIVKFESLLFHLRFLVKVRKILILGSVCLFPSFRRSNFLYSTNRKLNHVAMLQTFSSHIVIKRTVATVVSFERLFRTIPNSKLTFYYVSITVTILADYFYISENRG